MKSKRIVTGIAGLLLFFSIVITFVWLLSPAGLPPAKSVTFDEARNLIRNKQIKEITFRQSEVELVDDNKNKYSLLISSDSATGETLLNEINSSNQENPRAAIKTTLEPVSSGYSWILMLNAPFYIMWAITLAVIVYAVRVLSRNKG